MTNIKELKKIVSSWAISFPGISRVWLFGSRAKNTHYPESDIDIAIEIEVVNPDHETARAHWMCEKKDMVDALQKHIKPQIHLLHFDEENPKVYVGVSDHGILLFDKSERLKNDED